MANFDLAAFIRALAQITSDLKTLGYIDPHDKICIYKHNQTSHEKDSLEITINFTSEITSFEAFIISEVLKSALNECDIIGESNDLRQVSIQFRPLSE